MNAKKFNSLSRPSVIATVIAIIKQGNKVLLTKRNINPHKGRWCLPGGHIELGESALAAVKREVKEETGLSLKNTKFVNYSDEYFPRLHVHAVTLVFKARSVGREKPDSKEVKKERWFTLQEINKLNCAFKHKEIIRKHA